MAKVTGSSTKEKTDSTKPGVKDILRKGMKFTPIGITKEAAAKAAEALKSKMGKAEQKPADSRPKSKPFKMDRINPDPNPLEKPKNKFKREPFRFKNPSVRPQRKAEKEGGRIGLKAGSKGCKLAKRGRGRAYGKNS